MLKYEALSASFVPLRLSCSPSTAHGRTHKDQKVKRDRRLGKHPRTQDQRNEQKEKYEHDPCRNAAKRTRAPQGAATAKTADKAAERGDQKGKRGKKIGLFGKTV